MGEVKLSDKSYNFSELETKYLNFYAPSFIISVDGVDLVKKGASISTVTVDTSIDKADTFSFTVTNAYDAVKQETNFNKYLKPGKNIEISMGYVDKLETVFNGLITSLAYDFSSDGSPKVTVGGMDLSLKMMKGTKSRSWTKKKHSEVVSAVASSYVSNTKVDNTTVIYDVVEQYRMNDYEFLDDLAKQNHFEFFVAGKTLYFRKPHTNKTPVVIFKWGENLLSFSPEIDIADQVVGIEVRGMDDKDKPVTAKSGSINVLNPGKKTGKDILTSVCGADALEHSYTSVGSTEEAQVLADAEMNEKAMKLVSGRGESIGIPEIRAGLYVRLKGLGTSLNQLYYITSATHTINSSGYITAFNIGGNTI